jgi:hypothetical protein
VSKRLDPETDGSRLVFVGGLHRSGTTALARALALHPEVSGLAGTGVEEDEGQHLQTVYPAAEALGGPGRFARHRDAHLTEDSPLATTRQAQRLLEQWSPHWDTGRPLLLEKSPPNLVRTRFLQQLFPGARFVVIVRHPVVVTLSTRKWAPRTGLTRLTEHWFLAHATLTADAPRVKSLLVLKYEHLVSRPEETLHHVAQFLELRGQVPAHGIAADRSQRYEEQWAKLRAGRSLSRRRVERLIAHHEQDATRFGYRMSDLTYDGPVQLV